MKPLRSFRVLATCIIIAIAAPALALIAAELAGQAHQGYNVGLGSGGFLVVVEILLVVNAAALLAGLVAATAQKRWLGVGLVLALLLAGLVVGFIALFTAGWANYNAEI